MNALSRWTRVAAGAALLAGMSLTFSSPAAADGGKDGGEVKNEKETAKTPEEAFTQLKKAVEKKDGERFWALLSKDSQKILEQMGEGLKTLEGESRDEAAKELGIKPEDMAQMSAKDLTLAKLFSDSNAEERAEIQEMEIKDIAIDEDKAEGTRVQEGKDVKERAFFIKEDGEWKLDVARELKAGSDEDPPEPPPVEPPKEPGDDKK